MNEQQIRADERTRVFRLFELGNAVSMHVADIRTFADDARPLDDHLTTTRHHAIARGSTARFNAAVERTGISTTARTLTPSSRTPTPATGDLTDPTADVLDSARGRIAR